MMEPIKPEYETFHSCMCFGHAIEVVCWDDEYVDINYWQMGSGNWRGFFERVVGAWRMLRYGTVFVDNVMLSADGAEKMARSLMEASERIRNKDESGND